jgi:hypothetical protein
MGKAIQLEDSDVVEIRSAPKDIGFRADPKVIDLRPVHHMEREHYYFLKEFSRHLDMEIACKVVNWTPAYVKQLCEKHDGFRAEMNMIYDDWRKTIRMNAKSGAGRFLQILDKMEEQFDKDPGKMAGALSKMAGDLLRATGNMDSKTGLGTQQPAVQVNIQLNNAKEQMKPVVSVDQYSVEDL